MGALLEALRAFGLPGHVSRSGRLLIIEGERGRVFVAEASGGRGYYVWCEQPDGRAVERHADPVAAIREGLRRAARGEPETGRPS